MPFRHFGANPRNYTAGDAACQYCAETLPRIPEVRRPRFDGGIPEILLFRRR